MEGDKGLFPEDFVNVGEIVLVLDFFENLRITLFFFGLLGLFPFPQQGGWNELECFFQGSFDTPESLPVGDHQQSQDSEENVRAGEEGSQSADGKEEGLSDQQEYVFGPLPLEEEVKFHLHLFFVRLSGVEYLDFILIEFQDFSECLLLPQDPLREQHQFFFGRFPEFFPARGFDLDLADWIGGKIPVSMPVIADKEESHRNESF